MERKLNGEKTDEKHILFDDDDIVIVNHGTAELWDQMRSLIRSMPWTTQDEATWQLLPEQTNVHPCFAIRKSDGAFLGGSAIIETDIFYGAYYAVQPGLRGMGFGMKMTLQGMAVVLKALGKKPFLGRAVKEMLEKYEGPPLNAVPLNELYSFTLSRDALLRLFTSTGSSFTPKSLKDMNEQQFDKVCEYDAFVVGRNRRTFLKDFHSLFFTKGVALLDANGDVHGLVSSVPTLCNRHLIKIGPIFAENRDDACYLIKCIVEQFTQPEVRFVIHITTGAAGDWILEKCRDAGVPLHMGAVTICATNKNNAMYKDPCKTEYMYAPMNCPLYFDR
ncbi:hypothetical protein Q1695_001444 [Nippostrongylus brasiliensis]|nr:hypothetical protein Q1695_001444 [Nippostrongylus brasiliensis]